MSKVAGNCTRCGSPIFGTCPEDVRRTCNCVFTCFPQTIHVNNPPTRWGEPWPWPWQPYVTYGTTS